MKGRYEGEIRSTSIKLYIKIVISSYPDDFISFCPVRITSIVNAASEQNPIIEGVVRDDLTHSAVLQGCRRFELEMKLRKAATAADGMAGADRVTGIINVIHGVGASVVVYVGAVLAITATATANTTATATATTNTTATQSRTTCAITTTVITATTTTTAAATAAAAAATTAVAAVRS